jgi:CRISPR/Cas system-associated endonuclease Cas1
VALPGGDHHPRHHGGDGHIGGHSLQGPTKTENAKLEPYLGFLHSTQFGKPSLVCDFQELYRYLIDDFLIYRCQRLKKRDFVLKTEFFMKTRAGKRVFLRDIQADGLFEALNNFFESKVEIPRMKAGKKQTLETLINEEALLFMKFLRGERKIWVPRIPHLITNPFIISEFRSRSETEFHFS